MKWKMVSDPWSLPTSSGWFQPALEYLMQTGELERAQPRCQLGWRWALKTWGPLSAHSVKSRDKPATWLAPFAVVISCHGSIEVIEITPICTHTIFIWPFIYLFLYLHFFESRFWPSRKTVTISIIFLPRIKVVMQSGSQAEYFHNARARS